MAYIVDSEGPLIFHPDLSLAADHTDMTWLAQVIAARAGPAEAGRIVKDSKGRELLVAHAVAAPLDWLVFLELPSMRPMRSRNKAIAIYVCQCLLWVCAVIRRRFPVGASPTRRTLQPEAAGAAMEVTK